MLALMLSILLWPIEIADPPVASDAAEVQVMTGGTPKPDGN